MSKKTMIDAIDIFLCIIICLVVFSQLFLMSKMADELGIFGTKQNRLYQQHGKTKSN